MKVLAFIERCFVDGSTPAGNCSFNVSFLTSDGQLSSNGVFNADLTLNETQIAVAVKTGVVAAVNAALGTTLNVADVRLF